MVRPEHHQATAPSVSGGGVHMLGMWLLLGVVAVNVAKAQEMPTYDDLRPALEVAIYPAPPAGYQGALSPKGVELIWNQIVEHLGAGGSTDIDRQHLAAIRIQVEPGPGTQSRAGGSTIVLADGHLRAASLFAYAGARLEADSRLLSCYNMWFDFFIDALAYGDPAVPLDDGYFEMLQALASGEAPNESLKEAFTESIFGWMAFLLAHEAGHIILNHGNRLQQQFRDLPKSVAEWPDEAKRLTQRFELEADRFAVDLTIASAKFSPGAVASWFQWQAVHHVAAMAQVGVSIDQLSTHPPPHERFEAVLKHLVNEHSYHDLPVNELVDYFQSLIDKYDRALLAGRVNELFPMRGRPVSIRVKHERAVKRISKLMLCTNRVAISPN